MVVSGVVSPLAATGWFGEFKVPGQSLNFELVLTRQPRLRGKRARGGSVVVNGVVSCTGRHGLVRWVWVVFQFAAKDFHVAGRGQSQGDSFAGHALDDDFDTIADEDAFSDFAT